MSKKLDISRFDIELFKEVKFLTEGILTKYQELRMRM